MASPINRAGGILGVLATLRRAGMIGPMRPDRYLKMAAAMRREGMSMTANYKAPREIAVLDELPRGSTGEIRRAELRSRVGG